MSAQTVRRSPHTPGTAGPAAIPPPHDDERASTAPVRATMRVPHVSLLRHGQKRQPPRPLPERLHHPCAASERFFVSGCAETINFATASRAASCCACFLVEPSASAKA